MDQKNIASNLYKLRIANNLSIEKVSVFLKVSEADLLDFENGQEIPDLPTYKLLCDLYGIEMFWLFKEWELIQKNAIIFDHSDIDIQTINTIHNALKIMHNHNKMTILMEEHNLL